MLLSQQLLPVMREVSGEFFVFQQDNAPAHRARDTVRLSSRQHQRSFHRIFGQRTAPTLIRLITGSGASSSSKSTSRGFTTLTNWNSVCSKCGVTSTRASLTMQLTSGVFVHACRQTADTLSKCCRKQHAYLYSTVWQHKRFIFVKYDYAFKFFCCNLQ